MTSNEIREKFLGYFAAKAHARIESSSLVPQADPTLLFTNAGMVQFKKVFMGEEKRDYVRAVTCQRCVRAGGKHNDLENVGHTARHHTFFEMLGNFSFGDYFKAEAIDYAWEFLTETLALPREKLWVTVFENDDEAAALWAKKNGLPLERIMRLGEKDNFWAMGDTGPCGPCSEILIDQGPSVGCGQASCRPGCDCDRYLELWNLVFMQFYRDETGAMTALPRPCIDTGMGLERISAVVQGKVTNYDSDLFSGLIARIAALSGIKYGADARLDTAIRVIADHSRATAFLVSDGVLPSNEGRGYVLRRIMRRAIRFGRLLGLTKPFLAEITEAVVGHMAQAYPHLAKASDLLARVVRHEEERFLETLDFGLSMLAAELERLHGAAEKSVPGEFVFKLYDTYGLPIDIVRDIAGEQGLLVDEAGFNAAMDAQRQLSKKSWKAGRLDQTAPGLRALVEAGKTSQFVGYSCRACRSSIIGLVGEDGEAKEQGGPGELVSIICSQTPFYAESGGQVGDHGIITGGSGRARVHDTVALAEGLIIHKAEILEGMLRLGDEVDLQVIDGRRQSIENNHTATHLLQAALREVLGNHVKQSGSLVSPERLRFDFTHFSPVTSEELRRVEDMVNEKIRANISVATEVLGREQAMQAGATALFGEKYGDSVRVVGVGEFSKELCGGTHVKATGEIGLFRIVGESGIAAGIRRVEALTGAGALARMQQDSDILEQLSGIFKGSADDLVAKVEGLLTRQREFEREVSQLTAKLTTKDLDGLLKTARMVDGVRVLAAQVPLDNPKTLREVGDRVRDKMGSGVAVLGGVFDNKAALLAIVTNDLTKRFHAGQIISKVAAAVGGKGGGRPDMAQAGGPLADKLPEALESVYDIVQAASAPGR